MAKKSKQVIVVRGDLKMPKGKAAAQVAHASLKAILDHKKANWNLHTGGSKKFSIVVDKDSALEDWLAGIFTKITLKVNSEAELLEIYQNAKDADLPVALIKDAGHTIFNEPTLTCCAIGPDWDIKIDKITGHLKMY